jgi:hypothetical protein
MQQRRPQQPKTPGRNRLPIQPRPIWPTLSTRPHPGPPLAPHHIPSPPARCHVPFPSTARTGGVPDADAGREIIIIGRTPRITSSSWLASTPRDIRRAWPPLRSAPPPPLLCSAPPPQGSNPRASPSPSPPSFSPRYELACRSRYLFFLLVANAAPSVAAAAEFARSARCTPICATAGEAARHHCSSGCRRDGGWFVWLGRGFKAGLEWIHHCWQGFCTGLAELYQFRTGMGGWLEWVMDSGSTFVSSCCLGEM